MVAFLVLRIESSRYRVFLLHLLDGVCYERRLARKQKTTSTTATIPSICRRIGLCVKTCRRSIASPGPQVHHSRRRSGLQIRALKFQSSSSKFPRARTCELVRARSRLYRSQILQVNTRWKALAEIYTMHSFAPFSNLNFFVKNRQKNLRLN